MACENTHETTTAPSTTSTSYTFTTSGEAKPEKASTEKRDRRMHEDAVEFHLRRFGLNVLRIIDASLANEPQRTAVRMLIAEAFDRQRHNVFEYFWGDDQAGECESIQPSLLNGEP